jgi:hypothetical protein
MTREEAERRCSELALGHPERVTHRWIPREMPPGEWSVIKIAIPPGATADELTASQEERPRPSTPEDPRGSSPPPFAGPTGV